jgi:hypothetical protein
MSCTVVDRCQLFGRSPYLHQGRIWRQWGQAKSWYVFMNLHGIIFQKSIKFVSVSKSRRIEKQRRMDMGTCHTSTDSSFSSAIGRTRRPPIYLFWYYLIPLFCRVFSITVAARSKAWTVFARSDASRSQWPRVLRHELSSPAQTLGSWVLNPL